MKKLIVIFTVFVTFLGVTLGKTVYVNANYPTDGNGTSWSSPYTNLQDAVTASSTGDLILVTNGVYSPISTGNKAITIQSVSGYADTIIDGGGTTRCATLGTGVVLDGFTTRNGASTDGGGTYGGSVLNSVIENCTASNRGGGIYAAALVSNCVVRYNTCTTINVNYGGGGVYNSLLVYSTVHGNIATNGTRTNGGGVLGGIVRNCEIYENRSLQGGGVCNAPVYDSNVSSNTAVSGGGIWQTSGLTTVTNTVISGNTANTTGGGTFGGTLTGCTISGNTAYTGGGIFGATMVSNCIVANNIARSPVDNIVGGGIHGNGVTVVMDSLISGNIATNTYAQAGGVGYATVYRCRIENNTARLGGGTYMCSVYDNSTIVSNIATYSGGGVGTYSANTHKIHDSVIEYNSTIAAHAGGTVNMYVSNCIVRGNTANTYGGGAVRSALTDCTISGNTANTEGGGAYDSALTDCTISGNTATRFGGGLRGGIAYSSSIIGNTATNSAGTAYSTLYNCKVVGNVARTFGGALERGMYYNCTFYGNTAPRYAVGGSNGHASQPSFYNCTIYGNVNTGPNINQLDLPSGGIFYCSSIDSVDKFNNGINTPTVFPIYGNPLFTDPANDDFTLLPTSPCINKGANQYVTTPTDLAGSPRIKDWRVDMGAYERQSTRFSTTPNALYPMGTRDNVGREYVQDGLIQWWDGYVVSDSNLPWPQLVPGTDNAMTMYTRADMYNAYTPVTGVGWVFSTNGTYRTRGRLDALMAPFFVSNGPPATIELVVTPRYGGSEYPAIACNSGGRGVNMMRLYESTPSWGYHVRYMPSSKGLQPKTVNHSGGESGKLFTVSAMFNDGNMPLTYVNSEPKTPNNYGGLTASDATSQTWIGGDNYFAGYGFIGTIHAIRIYNRILTEAEVRLNWELDVKRFGTP